MEFLRLASHPQVDAWTCEAHEGALSLSLPLERNEVCLVEVLPQADESSTYWGLDDTLVGYPGGEL